MADAVSPTETELRREFEKWAGGFVFEKWAGGFVGVFPLGKDRYGDYQSVLTGNVWIGWRKAFEAGERKEREQLRESSGIRTEGMGRARP